MPVVHPHLAAPFFRLAGRGCEVGDHVDLTGDRWFESNAEDSLAGAR
ncbi:MAG: hypothetical protein AB8G14_18885 [Ilumatobacter sp.]